MTTPKEALELKPCPFCGGEAESDSQRGYRNISTGNPENAAAIYCTKCSADMTWCYRDTPEIERDQVMTLLIEQWNTRALASLQGEDAVERVDGCICQNQHRRGYCTEPGCPYSTSDAVERVKALAHRFWSIHPSTIAAMNLTREEFYVREMMALLATGLVPDEAAVRADEREKCERRVEELDCLYINDERCPFGGIPADPETSIRREAIKECLAAIRSNQAKP